MEIPFALSYQLELSQKTDFGIGIVGAGAIVESAHMPAYQRAGFRILGIYDRLRDRAEKIAGRFSIPKVYRTLEEMLEAREIEILDVAVPPNSQEEIVRQTLRASKHLLCQKPLSTNFSKASLLVKKAAESNCHLAVNENMRWDPAMRTCRGLIDEGWIGQPILATFDINYKEEWSNWPWLVGSERLTILFDAIHPIYVLRMLFNEPEGVFCVIGRSPVQRERGETRAMVVMEFPNQVTASVLDCSTNPTGDIQAAFRFQGTEGSIKGTLGIYYNYPNGLADTIAFTSKNMSPSVWISPELKESWIPDAFAGPMAALMKSLEDGNEPENSGGEHLKTLQVVEAAYRSAMEKRTVSPLEIT